MPIQTITSHSDFAALRSNWENLYASDSEATVFLSWQWQHDNILRHPNRQYIILAWAPEKATSQYQAFLPLCHRVILNKPSKRIEPIIGMAGNYWADFTGVICNPEYEQQALSDLSAYLAAQAVYQFRLDGLRMSDARQAYLLSAFNSKKFKHRRAHPKANKGKTNLSVAPIVHLPETEEQWLLGLSANTRQKIRRYRRLLEQTDNLTLSRSNGGSLSQDIAEFETLWRQQWNKKTDKNGSRKARYYSRLIHDGIKNDHLYFKVLKQNNKLVAATAVYTDPVYQQQLFFVSCRDPDFTTLPAGLLMHADNIRQAIKDGFKQYNLLQGDESYKYSLGATDVAIDSIRIKPRQTPVHARLLPISLKTRALKLLLRNQPDGASGSIETVYSQLLESYPNDADVLNQYKDWLSEQGEQRTATSIADYLVSNDK